jgi:hypothetical protein
MTKSFHTATPIMHKPSTKNSRNQPLAGPALARRSLLVWLLPVTWVPALPACSSAPRVADTQGALMERAGAYWAATVKNDLITAWPLEDASLDPRWTLQDYLKRGGINYEAAAVKGIKTLDADQAVLDVEIRFSLPQLRLRNQVSVIADRWRMQNGVWYHVLGRNTLFEQPK